MSLSDGAQGAGVAGDHHNKDQLQLDWAGVTGDNTRLLTRPDRS